MMKLIWLIPLLLLIPFVASDLTCEISTQCTGQAILRLSNETGGGNNSHAQIANYFCLQENATSATSCGGLSTGKSNVNGSWQDSGTNLTDGNYTTRDLSSSGTAYLYVNYTMPGAAKNGSLWQVKRGTILTNSSINRTCFDSSPVQLRIRSVAATSTLLDCYNGSAWIATGTTDTTSEEVYEEAMYWNMSYEYAVCCTSTGQTLNSSCTGPNFLNLSAETNAHVQDPNYASPTGYDYQACIGGLGSGSCQTVNGTCPAGHTCLFSMASDGSVNQTNAHIADCGYYKLQLCCSLNSPPTHTTPVLNASDHPTNSTSANLSVFNKSTTDADGDTVYNTFDWRNNSVSIANLTMSFNVNVSINTTDGVRDYSTHDNDGTLGRLWTGSGGSAGRNPEWNSSCVVGGCYNFDGKDDVLLIQASGGSGFTDNDFTVEAWINYRDDSSNQAQVVMSKYSSASDQRVWALSGRRNTNRLRFNMYDIGQTNYEVEYNLSINNWHHVMAVRNGTNIYIYINGSRVNTSTGPASLDTSNPAVYIGAAERSSTQPDSFFNGSIDEIRYFPRAMPAAYAAQRFADTKDGSSSSATIPFPVTNTDDVWSVAVTPSDGQDDGLTKISNSLTVTSGPPTTPVLLLPKNDNNSVFERYTVFDWEDSTDPDGDTIYYTINISAPQGCAAIPLRNITNDVSTYTSIEELCVDNTYNWTVKACDNITGCSAWASQFNFTIESTVIVNFTTNNTDFGSMLPSTPTTNISNDTIDDDPGPLVLENTGNVDINLRIKANDALWTNQPLNTTYFLYADQDTHSWTNVTLNYTSWYNNLAYTTTRQLEINVTSPENEPPGSKDSVLSAEAVTAE